MKTFHLAFPDEAAALTAFGEIVGAPVASLAEVPPWVSVSGLQCAVDVLGPVDASFGETDGGGRPITGFRVNIGAPDDAVLPEPLRPREVVPAAPMRVFG